jgi:glycosyltransferase involved in cell wall biosynthesis
MKAVFDPHARAAMRERKPLKHLAISTLAPGYAAADRLLWRRLERVIAISEEVKSRIVGGRLAAAERVEVIYPGVDVARFTPGPPDRDTRLLAAGRISWYKNFELAIDTVRELSGRGHPTDLVIAGFLHPSDESYLAALRERAAGLPVRFVIGPTDDELIELYRTSDLMLFTAVNEDFGIAPIEAMACGTPVIAVNSGGPRETIADGRSGWLVEDSPAAFAHAVEAWQSSADKASMRASTRVHAEAFDWGAFVEHIDRTMEATARRT